MSTTFLYLYVRRWKLLRSSASDLEIHFAVRGVLTAHAYDCYHIVRRQKRTHGIGARAQYFFNYITEAKHCYVTRTGELLYLHVVERSNSSYVT